MRSEICGTGRERKLLGNLLLQARGIRGVREVAAEIGISATSLNRAEKGRAQDIGTTDKLIVWLKSKPARADQLQIAFRNKTRINPRIALALAHLAIAARNQLAASSEIFGTGPVSRPARPLTAATTRSYCRWLKIL